MYGTQSTVNQIESDSDCDQFVKLTVNLSEVNEKFVVFI